MAALLIASGWRGRVSPRAGLRLPGGDPLPQVAVHELVPGQGTAVEALERRRQAPVGEADFRLVALPGDLEHDVRALPLLQLLHEFQAGVIHVPDDLLAA